MEKDLKRIEYRDTKGMHNSMVYAALDKGISVSDLIRLAVRQYLKENN